MGRNFHNLDVYKKAYAFVLDCYPATDHLEDKAIISQLRRALLSIPLNIAEGCGSRSEKVLLNHLSYAYGSAREVEVLVCVCCDLGYFDDLFADALLASLDEVKRMLFGFLQKVERDINDGKTTFAYNRDEFR